MKTGRQKAFAWVSQNVVLSENAPLDYYELIESLSDLLKEQDRDTRHACAENVIAIDGDGDTIDRAHFAVMNTAVV